MMATRAKNKKIDSPPFSLNVAFELCCLMSEQSVMCLDVVGRINVMTLEHFLAWFGCDFLLLF